jgi:hypothetical protein
MEFVSSSNSMTQNHQRNSLLKPSFLASVYSHASCDVNRKPESEKKINIKKQNDSFASDAATPSRIIIINK